MNTAMCKLTLSTNQMMKMCNDDHDFFDVLAEKLGIEADGGDSAGDFLMEMIQETRREFEIRKHQAEIDMLMK